MQLKGKKKIKLSDITVNLFVRKQLDTDHVMYLAELIESGVTMSSPIKVSEDMIMVDGRHRKEAYELNNINEVEVEIYKFNSDAELISEAYKANTGGSKPPTPQDTEHTVMLLIDRKEKINRIAELLGLPQSLARKYASEVKSRMNRAKLQRAAAAITDGGLTVAKAAEQYEVDGEKLKEILSGRRRKHKNGVQDLHGDLTRNYRSIGSKNGRAMGSLLEKFQDGDVTAKQVRDIFAHLKKLQDQSKRAITDWQKRFEAIADSK
jgi:predicted transcriptional regulator